MTRINLTLAVGLLVAMAAALAYPGAARSAEQVRAPQKATSVKEQIVGTWRLASIFEQDAGAEDIAQFGPGQKGLFMADRQGNFSFQIMSSSGRRYAASGGSSAGMMKSARLVDAMTYFGTYAVDQQDHKLTLQVTTCLYRSCDKTERTAELRIRGNTMEFISAAEMSPTGAHYSHIVWKRECCR